MTSLADRLRGVIKPGKTAFDHPEGDDGSQESIAHTNDGDAADVLGGEWRQSAGHRFLVVERKYAPGHRHGSVALADCLPPDGGAWRRLPLLIGAADAERSATALGRLLFLDLETTGLAGGAGTYAFLVGCGWFEGAVFRVRQFFLSTFAAERVLLQALTEVAAATACVVTYNGKTFDLPLLESRYSLQRMQTPFADLPHLDMLYPARRLWREDDVECRLTSLERMLYSHCREDDVPGFEIPARYFTYVRSGNPCPLAGVLEHNRRDIVSLAMLTARASQLLEDGPGSAMTAREALGMGRLYERAGMTEEALASFSRAFDDQSSSMRVASDAAVRAEALRAYATLCRRLRRYESAADAWRRLLDLRVCPAGFVREAIEALAVHHEHRARDLPKARGFAARALQLPLTAPRQQAVQYRLARLDRKLAAQSLFPVSW